MNFADFMIFKLNNTFIDNILLKIKGWNVLNMIQILLLDLVPILPIFVTLMNHFIFIFPGWKK